jgi:hypothetical protein
VQVIECTAAGWTTQGSYLIDSESDRLIASGISPLRPELAGVSRYGRPPFLRLRLGPPGSDGVASEPAMLGDRGPPVALFHIGGVVVCRRQGSAESCCRGIGYPTNRNGSQELLTSTARVLNQQLRGDFERWHPALRTTDDPIRAAA